MYRTTNKHFVSCRAINRLLTLLTVFGLLSLGVACSVSNEAQEFEQSEVASTTALPTISVVPTVDQTVTPTIVTPEIQASPQQPISTEPAIVPIVTATKPAPPIQATVQVQQNCSESAPTLDDIRGLPVGLVVQESLDGQKGIAVLGDDGLDNPLYFLPLLTEGSVSSFVSPDKEWLAYYSLNWNDGSFSTDITVINLITDQKYTTYIENLRLLPFDAQLRWANNTQIVIPLENEDELFHWMVWYPFEDRQETISLELTGIGKDVEKYNVPPVYDPLLELVIYPCEQCGNTEYQVKSLETGKIVWQVDIGPDPSSFAYRGIPVWSPDGEFVAIVGGRNLVLNGLWIFNRQGILVYEIILPDIGGVVAAAKLVWSPNSKYLAFSRGIPKPDGWYDLTLAYLAIDDGSITDLCVDLSTGFPEWSPDSEKIVFSSQIQDGELSRLISVVDIITGDVVQMFDENGMLITGWMQ